MVGLVFPPNLPIYHENELIHFPEGVGTNHSSNADLPNSVDCFLRGRPSSDL